MRATHGRYAPKGDSLGNSWRIAGDGTNWGALSNCANLNAYEAPQQKRSVQTAILLACARTCASSQTDDKCALHI